MSYVPSHVKILLAIGVLCVLITLAGSLWDVLTEKESNEKKVRQGSAPVCSGDSEVDSVRSGIGCLSESHSVQSLDTEVRDSAEAGAGQKQNWCDDANRRSPVPEGTIGDEAHERACK